jgi:hypothetical protein
MPRFTALTLTAAMVIVLFCCPPPALAQEQPKVMICPITHEPCRTKSKCDPPVPQLIASAATAPAMVMPFVASIDITPNGDARDRAALKEVVYWSAPMRSVVLRI